MGIVTVTLWSANKIDGATETSFPLSFFYYLLSLSTVMHIACSLDPAQAISYLTVLNRNLDAYPQSKLSG